MSVPYLQSRKPHHHGLGIVCYIVPQHFDILEKNWN